MTYTLYAAMPAIIIPPPSPLKQSKIQHLSNGIEKLNDVCLIDTQEKTIQDSLKF